MDIVRSPNRLHVIPIDDETKVESIHPVPCTSTRDSSVPPLMDGMVADLTNHPDRLKESIDEVTHAREVLCTVASAVIKQQAMEVDRNVALYCRRVQDRRRAKRRLMYQTNRILSGRKLEKSDSNRYSKMGHCATNGTDRNVNQSMTESHQQLPDQGDDELEMMIMNDDTDEDRRERAMIFDQAYRMKRMTSLVRLIDASQRRLLKELHDCHRSYASVAKSLQSTNKEA